jgi:hypothetical protein
MFNAASTIFDASAPLRDHNHNHNHDDDDDDDDDDSNAPLANVLIIRDVTACDPHAWSARIAPTSAHVVDAAAAKTPHAGDPRGTRRAGGMRIVRASHWRAPSSSSSSSSSSSCGKWI